MKRREFVKLLLSSAIPAASCNPSYEQHSSEAIKHIVLILVDQLRLDSFHRWCTSLVNTARQGVVIGQMRSSAPWTYPSVVSLLSGLYPQQHGADGHAVDNTVFRFSEDVPLLQNILAEHDYKTAAFVANPFLCEWNPFHMGFKTFNAEFVKSADGRRPSFEEFGLPEKMFSPSVNRRVLEHFNSFSPSCPEFTYIHYIDVHGPWKGAPFRPSYEQAVRFIDRKVMNLYRYFMKRYRENVYFIVTSDHGRALDDDLSVGYGPTWRKMKQSVHDFNLRIPFVFLPSKLITAPRKIDVWCSNIDFVPTILDLIDIKVDIPFAGISLFPLMQGYFSRRKPRAVYAKHSAFGDASDCVIIGKHKYIRFFDANTGRLQRSRIFNLVRDTRETHSLGSDFGSIKQVMTMESGGRGYAFSPTQEDLSPQTEKQLRRLGYLQQ